jgi:raffinose/stachyose/melibiose transport system substrate-binding protein
MKEERMGKRIMGVAVLAVFLAAGAFAGGQQQTSAKVVVKFLGDNENFVPRFKDVISAWEAKTGNRVDVQLFPAVEYSKIISARMMAGEGPDLYRTDAIDAAEIMWPKDWPESLNDRPFAKRLSPGGVAIVAWSDGKITGVPITNPGAMAVMYNKDIFAKVGVTVPKTWPEFIAVCEKIKQAGIIPMNIQLATGSEFGTTHIMHALFSNVELTRKAKIQDFWKGIDAGTTKFSDVGEYKTALYQMQELRQKGLINEDFLSTTFDKAQENFATEKVAMHQCGDFILSPMLAKYPGIESKIGTFTMPFGDTPGVASVYAPVGVSVNAKSKNKAAALDFVDFFASKDVQDEYMRKSPGTSIFSDIQGGSNPISKDLSAYILAGKAVKGAYTRSQVWPEMDARKLMQEFFLGLSPEEVLKKLDEKAAVIAKGKNLPGW